MFHYYFTSESVSEGHPDKLADQISDAILDHYLAFDDNSKVACETLVTTDRAIIAGEINSTAQIEIEQIVRNTISNVGYNKVEYLFEANTCEISNILHEQSVEINKGVEKPDPKEQGAGDQGIMFGFATNETDSFLPLTLDIAHKLVYELALIRKEGKVMKYLRPDAKSQVTIEYSENHEPIRIDNLVISTQHDEFIVEEDQKAAEIKMQTQIKKDIVEFLFPRVKEKLPEKFKGFLDEEFTLHVNPTGSFIIGGPHGDTGLTGRKIIVDTYGGRGAHGGGAFSGKDPSKVDRSAAYAARYIAKNLVKAGVCDEALVQLSYAIGVAEPCGVYVDTRGTSKIKFPDGYISEMLIEHYDLTPFGIDKMLNLRNPIYSETAAYGHMGREYQKDVLKTFTDKEGNVKQVKVDLFTWENTEKAEELELLFNINGKGILSLEEQSLKYKNHFRGYTDDELVALFNKEVGNNGWVGARGFYLSEMRSEFKHRNWNYSAISPNDNGFHLADGNQVYLKDKKLVLINAKKMNS